jgi:hypothetical protein
MSQLDSALTGNNFTMFRLIIGRGVKSENIITLFFGAIHGDVSFLSYQKYSSLKKIDIQ